jgi:hypothetical protein
MKIDKEEGSEVVLSELLKQWDVLKRAVQCVSTASMSSVSERVSDLETSAVDFQETVYSIAEIVKKLSEENVELKLVIAEKDIGEIVINEAVDTKSGASCSYCNGRGRRKLPNNVYQEWPKCMVCNGTGKAKRGRV